LQIVNKKIALIVTTFHLEP